MEPTGDDALLVFFTIGRWLAEEPLRQLLSTAREGTGGNASMILILMSYVHTVIPSRALYLRQQQLFAVVLER